MPASIGGASGLRALARASTVSLVLSPIASNVTVVSDSSSGLPAWSSATAMNTRREGGTTSRNVPDMGKSVS